MIVRCGSGAILGFGSKSVGAPLEKTLTLKKRSAVARFGAMPAATDSAQRWAVLELLHIALTTGGEGEVRAGELKFELSNLQNAESCEVQELFVADTGTEELDERVGTRQFGGALGSEVVGLATYEYAKSSKGKKQEGCVIRSSSAPGSKQFSAELSAAFFDGLDPKKAAFRNGPAPGGEPPPDSIGNELRLLLLGMVVLDDPVVVQAARPHVRVLGVGLGFGPKDAAQIAFTVVDRATGKTVMRGRASRAIGKDALKDMRELAKLVRCG